MNRLLIFRAAMLVLIVSEAQSRSAGPPLSSGTFTMICNQMMPSHSSIGAQSGNGGYTISTNIPRSGSTGYRYTAGQTYTVTLSGSTSNTFLGFIVEAHVPGQNQMLLGQFIQQNSNQRILDCDNVGAANAATVAHSNSALTNFPSMTFMWQAPSGSDGTVDFRYSVVRRFATFYVRQSAAANDQSPIPTTPRPPEQTTTAPMDTTTAPMGTTAEPLGQTTAIVQPPETTQPPPQTTVPDDSTTTPPIGSGGLTAPVTAPGDYRLTFRNPPDCAPSECEVFVGIGTNAGNSGYLDIYLEGQADGWVAVGFSGSASMSLADVVACNRNPSTDMVVALDTWNVQGYNNEVDRTQDVEQFSVSYSAGRINCSVAKKIAPSGSGQDLDLNNEYYVLYGRRTGASATAGALTAHDSGADNVPSISSMTVNPVVAGGSVGGLTAPVTAPGDYRLTFHNPPDCAPSECEVFVGIGTNAGNSGYLDIYLEGQADGWVAVGFSDSASMSLADVVACNRNPSTDMVVALDTWNVQGYNNEVDRTQDVEQFSSNYFAGRISCSVAKKIAPSGSSQDLDLNNEYYVLYGRRMGASAAAALILHEMGPNNPSISSMIVNPVIAGGSVGAQTFPTQQLLRLHGILMIIAWPLLALCGIFFASWMRPALPNGEWFQVHRAFLLASMFVGAAGFAVAFIANYQSAPSGLITLGSSNPVGTAHFAIGIVVMLMHIANPVIAIFRCKPTGKFRWIFNLLHGTTIGALAEVAALANVSLGTYLLFRGYTPLFWVFIAYLVLYFVMFAILLLLFTLSSCLSKDPGRKNLAPSLTKSLISSPESSGEKDVPLSRLDSPKTEDVDGITEEKPKKVPSKDSPIRWASFVIYVVISTPLMIALIGLVAGL